MTRTGLFIALCLAAVPALSQETGKWGDQGFFELTPYGAVSFGGSFTDEESNTEYKLNDSGSFGVLLDFREGPNTQWEVLYSLQDTEARVDGTDFADIKVHYVQGGGTYHSDVGNVRPFIAMTIGATHFDAKSDGFGSDTFFGWSIGGGMQIAPTNRIGIRLEARAFGTLVSSGSSIFCESNPAGGSAGCAITIKGDVFWQLQTMAGVVFRF